jgi:hydrogenase maturation protease
MSGRVLVAGVGNIFLGDDGFGVEVARRLAGEQLPEDVRVADFGIRGVHLAYELLDGYDTAILVDAAPRGGQPGTVYVIEPEPGAPPDGAPLMDAHGMEPDAVLGLLEVLGGSPVRVLVVGCEPAEVTERIGLSEPVAGAVEEAVGVVRELLAQREERKGERA